MKSIPYTLEELDQLDRQRAIGGGLPVGAEESARLIETALLFRRALEFYATAFDPESRSFMLAKSISSSTPDHGEVAKVALGLMSAPTSTSTRELREVLLRLGLIPEPPAASD